MSVDKLAWLGLLLLVSGCHHKSNLPEPSDRSDGQLPKLDVHRAGEHAIHVDGRLDEPAWQSAVSTGLFVNPGSGKPNQASHVNASAKMLYDENYLYVGFTVFDPAPSTPFKRGDVDPHIWERASGVELMLQPGDPGNNKNYFEIQVDTKGAVWDTRFDDYNRPITGSGAARRFGHQEWSAHLERAAHVDNGHYTIEMALPWSAITGVSAHVPPHPGDVWRANMYSFRDGQRDAMAWSPILGQGNFHKAARFGKLRFGPG